jgi:hypothetical protein
VNVAVEIVEGSIALLKVVLTAWLVQTPVADEAGLVDVTVGGVLSALVPVVKLHMKLDASALLSRSFAAVVIVALNKVLAARGLVGARIAVLPEYDTVPATDVVPGPSRLNVAGAVIVSGFIASLKVAVIFWLSGTAVAVSIGNAEITDGDVVSEAAPVVNDHRKAALISWPRASATSLLMLALKRVFARSMVLGVKVAI